MLFVPSVRDCVGCIFFTMIAQQWQPNLWPPCDYFLECLKACDPERDCSNVFPWNSCICVHTDATFFTHVFVCSVGTQPAAQLSRFSVLWNGVLSQNIFLFIVFMIFVFWLIVDGMQRRIGCRCRMENLQSKQTDDQEQLEKAQQVRLFCYIHWMHILY